MIETCTTSPVANDEFASWIDTFLEEKGIDPQHVFTVAGPSNLENIIPVGVVIEHAKIASPGEQATIKDTLVQIDFRDGDVLHYLEFLATGIAH
ncbi:hypothetical protein [Gordonia otitidis]|uniref:Uncharacterized protein n=1 Tax=Gordonia otitidis (strain DSM 44809 / CCUG 52243 / JCM 12355 / NBRC 100426 / IFM 10032) TaxID=1108044 RepID=H5TRS4_GORO1|nr:hypothetical protein [Gordonia otitidis]GAB36182.1 hypothetical protein GOOTI_202_00380 [Gordonia otitidis NBRC 100426]